MVPINISLGTRANINSEAYIDNLQYCGGPEFSTLFAEEIYGKRRSRESSNATF